jgi:hypothetical protein
MVSYIEQPYTSYGKLVTSTCIFELLPKGRALSADRDAREVGGVVVARRRVIVAAALMVALIGARWCMGGRWNWRAPGPLRRVRHREGLDPPPADAPRDRQPALVD